ncbi:protein-tyrosine phosphatase [Apostasia shenzhenica]|uniref:acid phosphatase n=1 Tax=Apostasia shenzhenica TaxID=1088818 RepID=A0A2I0BGD0_9ASPA|nr:protein-tyrosine phosphatase [Apostasia shenzhenica]
MESVLGPKLRFCHPPSPSDHSCALPLRSKPVYLTSRLLPIRLLRTVRPSSYSIVAASSSSPMADSARSAQASKPFSVLFVCLGNICRSPAAEAVFRDVVRKRGLDSSFKIDSAGTIGYHEGDPADPRMRAAAKSRGIEVTSISRPVRPSDFRDFDLILAMDLQNKDDLMSSLERWRHKGVLPEDAYKKVKLMCSYCRKHSEIEVPDPYYGGPQGFEKVLDLLEDACEVLLDNILAENRHISLS